MSDDIRNETRSSYDMGWEYGYKVARTMAVFAPLHAVPTAIEEEGSPSEYRRGFEDGFHESKVEARPCSCSCDSPAPNVAIIYLDC